MIVKTRIENPFHKNLPAFFYRAVDYYNMIKFKILTDYLRLLMKNPKKPMEL